MNLLLIDTCGATGSIALVHTPAGATSTVLASDTLPGRTASERLVPAIRALLAAQHTSLHSLAAVAVVHGPGSFTGVRVGLSAAKALCHALSLPLIAISRLAVLAQMAQLSSPTHRVHALLDAGRGEFYYGEYAASLCLREALLTRDGLLAAIRPGEIVIACEAVAHSLTQSLAPFTPLLVLEPTAADAVPLAICRLREATFDDITTIDANYLRRTDAQIFAKPKLIPQ